MMIGQVVTEEMQVQNVDLLLYGDRTKPITHNVEVFKIVHQFITDTKRFTN
jgi:hypothetical protein